MRKYVFGTLAAMSLVALTAPANALDRWHHGGSWGHWGGGPGFGVSIGFGGPAYGYADYDWDTGYYGAYAAAPGCTCSGTSYGYYPSAGYAYETDDYPTYGYSDGYEPGYAYGYDDYYGGGGFGVSTTFREGRRELREGRREFRTDRLSTRTSLRERGELNEGANIRTRGSLRGNANLRERGELSTTGMGGNFNANAQDSVRGTQFNASGGGSGGPNGNPNPKNMSGTGADTGAVSAGGRLGSSTRRSRGMQ